MDDGNNPSSKLMRLTPAECAKRTGLTVRALRVYERYGLLSAKRGQNDWRYYGVTELERLNTITALKTLGMSLAQIRELMHAKEPSLERVLELQVETWRTRKADAERGLVLAELALRRVQTHQPLSIDAICNLIRRLSFSAHAAAINSALNLVYEELTPAEFATAIEFLKRTFDLSRVPNQVEQELDYFKKLRQLMESGATPDSAEVQRILVERNKIGLHIGNHERALKMIEWNRELGMKFFAIESRELNKTLSRTDAEHDPSVIVTPRALRFLLEAFQHAPWTKPMTKLIEDTKELLVTNPDPTSDEARNLVRRYRQTFTHHSLGDPDVEAKLVPYRNWDDIPDRWPVWAGKNSKAAWFFLFEAVTLEPLA